MLYKTKTTVQLRTGSGGKGKITGVGEIIELSGKTKYMRDDTWNEISSSNYFGEYILMKDLEPYEPPEPPVPTETTPFTLNVVGYKPFSGELEPDA